MAWIVWVNGLRGPEPQKVYDGTGDKGFAEAGIKGAVIGNIKIADEHAELSLDELASKYPVPQLGTQT